MNHPLTLHDFDRLWTERMNQLACRADDYPALGILPQLIRETTAQIGVAIPNVGESGREIDHVEALALAMYDETGWDPERWKWYGQRDGWIKIANAAIIYLRDNPSALIAAAIAVKGATQ